VVKCCLRLGNLFATMPTVIMTKGSSFEMKFIGRLVYCMFFLAKESKYNQ